MLLKGLVGLAVLVVLLTLYMIFGNSKTDSPTKSVTTAKSVKTIDTPDTTSVNTSNSTSTLPSKNSGKKQSSDTKPDTKLVSPSIQPPQKPRYTTDEIENLNIGDEEKEQLKMEVLVYENYVASKEAVVPPSKPKHTLEEIENMNISDTEKEDLRAEVLTYKSFQTKNESVVGTDQVANESLVPPTPPKYTVEEIQSMDISDEEKENLLAEIVAYETYKASNEPSVAAK